MSRVLEKRAVTPDEVKVSLELTGEGGAGPVAAPGGAAGSVTSSFLAVKAGLTKYLMRFLVRRQDIEDIVQETFLRAYESERRQPIDFPKSFLFTVAKNLALSQIDKKATRLMSYVGDLQDLDVTDRHCVEDDVDAQQKLAVLMKVVAALPPQCQRVVVMKKMLGFSHDEIGGRLGISVRTVEKHLAKALQRCQDSREAEPVEARPVSPAPLPEKILAARGRRD